MYQKYIHLHYLTEACIHRGRRLYDHESQITRATDPPKSQIRTLYRQVPRTGGSLHVVLHLVYKNVTSHLWDQYRGLVWGLSTVRPQSPAHCAPQW